jgi:hypothetical protein
VGRVRIGSASIFSATVVNTMSPLNTFAALPTSATLLRSVVASTDFVANAI